MSRPDPPTRRSLFGLAGWAALSAPLAIPARIAGHGQIVPATGVLANPAHVARPALQVAGPADCALAHLARRMQAPLAARLTAHGALDVAYGGGVDGVTGANQFDARVAPDGETALLFPGGVALGWLAGTGSVRVDPTQMVPVFAAFGPGLLMIRGPLPSARTKAGHGRRRESAALRLAAGLDQAALLTALLGLDLLGIPARPVAPGVDPFAAASAGVADAVLLHGQDAAAACPALVALGFAPRFSLSPEPRDPDLLDAGVPSLLSALPQERLGQDRLVGAWRATAAASTLCAMMVLPRLSPAAALGRWRRAARDGSRDEHVIDLARRQAMRLVAGEDADKALDSMILSGATQAALHRWTQMQAG